MSPLIQPTSWAFHTASQVGTVPLYRYTDRLNFHCWIHIDFQGQHKESHELQPFTWTLVTSTADFPKWKEPELFDLTCTSSMTQFLQVFHLSFSGLSCFILRVLNPNVVLLDL